MEFTPCSPEMSGLSQDKLDKWRMTTMDRKIDEWTERFCSQCPNRTAEFCESQGWWRNFDGNIVFLDGIFGGYTQAERVERGIRRFDPVEA